MNRIIKRFLDMFLSALALVILSPVFVLVSIGIKLSSKGPVFYKASRVGINGMTFYMYKFRSMHIDDKAVEKSFIADVDRVFPLGGFLRKSKIDELPQLINIFLGHMSIVGPRPPATSNVNEIYTGEYENILSVKPGLTSYASLFDYKHGELFVTDNDKYISDVLPVKLKLELMYAENNNIFIDAKLIINTIVVIVQIVFGKKEFTYTKEELLCIDMKGLLQEAIK